MMSDGETTAELELYGKEGAITCIIACSVVSLSIYTVAVFSNLFQTEIVVVVINLITSALSVCLCVCEDE